MVKLFGVVFAAMLVCAHLADVQGDAYHRPLSMFRDYEPAWIGYALFGLLVAIGLETARTALRVQAEFQAVFYLVATALLAAVAATPSNDALHSTCAFAAMALMFVTYAVLLYRSDSLFWMAMHLLAPSFLMMASQLESYGIWQKGMILYFVAATIVHQALLAQELPRRARRKSTRARIRVGRKQAA
jgi:hypothetical protein